MRLPPATALAALVALGALSALPGCGEQSRVDPDAAVAVTGTVLDVDGAPLPDRPVRLGAGLTDGEVGFAVLTLGLSCSSGRCSGPVFDATTDADGGYALSLSGRDTQSSFGEAVPVLLSTSAGPADGDVSGAAVSARFRVQAADVRLPPLQLVDPRLALAGDAAVVATWATSAPGPYELTFEAADPVPAWSAVTDGGTATLDPRVLEDTAGRAVVSATRADAIEGSDVVVRWRSPGVAYVAGAGTPPSRGRAARFVDAAGATVGDAAAATDGDLGGDAPAPIGATAIVVDLGATEPVELVVVRGSAGGCAVDVSADGVAFEPAGSAADGFAAVAIDGRPVRAVRIGLSAAPGAGLREVSVWGPLVGPGLREADAGTLRGPFSSGGDGDDGPPIAVAVVAALLAAGVLVALGAALSRRARPAPRR